MQYILNQLDEPWFAQTLTTILTLASVFGLFQGIRLWLVKYFGFSLKTNRQRIMELEQHIYREQLDSIHARKPTFADIERGILKYDRELMKRYKEAGGNGGVEKEDEMWLGEISKVLRDHTAAMDASIAQYSVNNPQ